MTRINVYDTEAEMLEKICDDNDMTEAEVIELLFDYIDDMKADNNLS